MVGGCGLLLKQKTLFMISSATKNIINQLVPKGKFTGDFEALFTQVFHELDDLTPNALIATLINTLAESEDGFNPSKVKDLVTDLLARDRHTGYFIHPSLKTIFFDFAKWAAVQPSKKGGGKDRYFIIHGDFMNLSSVNDAIDRLPTNDVMAIICGIYQKELQKVVEGCLLSHRSMGDELAFIALKASKEDLEKAITQAEEITQNFVNALGLERLQHKKYEHKRGMGLVVAMHDLKTSKEDRAVKQALDASITKIKQTKPVNLAELEQGIEPGRLHNRSSERKVRKAIKAFKKYKIQLDKDAIKRAPPSIQSLTQILNGHAISWPRDDRIEYLRKHHDGTKMMMRADIFNLAGLNEVFGNEGADQIKDHIIHILYDVMESRLAQAHIFDCGGGIIDIVCSVMGDRAILDTACEIQQEIYDQILSKQIVEYAKVYDLPFNFDGKKKLSDIPHPRINAKGTGIIMAAHAVKPHRSLPEIIERLDKITNRTKMHGYAFLGYNSEQNVVGFQLNQKPEIRTLGKDGGEKNRHYLPFTRALKRHIHPDDIKEIFIRPIGQICEAVFGTDMQAVLGFKKAIRALQDVGIKDDDIEKIRTYDQMDIRLIATDLPPLSVVSTQKRPATMKRERESFMTMRLAEKLEGLPQGLTPYILETQAIFRLLKLLEPQGHHNADQSKRILLDELLAAPSSIVQDHQKARSLYDLAHLLDYGYACLEKDMPKKLVTSFDVYGRKTLYDIAQDMKSYGENSLAMLIEPHTMPPGGDLLRKDCLEQIKIQSNDLIEKMTKEKIFHEDQIKQIKSQIDKGLDQIKK